MSQIPVPDSAAQFWNLFQLFLYVGIIAGGAVVGMMIYFVLKNRYKVGKPERKLEPVSVQSRVREAIILAMISAIILFSLGVMTIRVATDIQYPPATSDSLVIDVTAFQWSFRFTYPNNASIIGEAQVPERTDIIFNVTSSDVMHNFGLPDFRLKIDAIPGRYNTVWITSPALNGATQTQYQIRCYELCGSGHTYMKADLLVVNQTAYKQWLAKISSTNMTGA